MSNGFTTSRKLAEAGFAPHQSAAIAEAVVEHTEKAAASKLDLFKLKAELEAAIARLEKRGDVNTAEIKTTLKVIAGFLIAMFVAIVAPYFS
jgi:hypothetical protein